MSIALEGFKILQSIGKNADLFASVRSDVDKAVRALFAKCMKAKTVDADDVRAIYKAVGAEAFDLLTDGLKDAESKSILTRLDKHNPELKAGSGAWRRERLRAIATGTEPASPPLKTAKKKAMHKTEAPKPLNSPSIDEYRASGKKNKKKDDR